MPILLFGHHGTIAHSDPLCQSFGTPVAMQPHLGVNNQLQQSGKISSNVL